MKAKNFENDFRTKLAKTILHGCPAGGAVDHQTIADAIRNGLRLKDLLQLPAVDAWPETAFFLKRQFYEFEKTLWGAYLAAQTAASADEQFIEDGGRHKPRYSHVNELRTLWRQIHDENHFLR